MRKAPVHSRGFFISRIDSEPENQILREIAIDSQAFSRSIASAELGLRRRGEPAGVLFRFSLERRSHTTAVIGRKICYAQSAEDFCYARSDKNFLRDFGYGSCHWKTANYHYICFGTGLNQSSSMPELSEHRTDPEIEFRYRDGYVHGVHEMITAVEPYLTEDQLWKFRQWATGPLFAWRRGKGEFFAPPAPGLEAA